MLHGSKIIIKHKVGLLNLAEELGNVSQACRIMGLSRDTFYRYKSAVDENGLDALFDKNRRKPNCASIILHHYRRITGQIKKGFQHDLLKSLVF
jgi:ACT domain-containing protein